MYLVIIMRCHGAAEVDRIVRVCVPCPCCVSYVPRARYIHCGCLVPVFFGVPAPFPVPSVVRTGEIRCCCCHFIYSLVYVQLYPTPGRPSCYLILLSVLKFSLVKTRLYRSTEDLSDDVSVRLDFTVSSILHITPAVYIDDDFTTL